MDHTGDGFLILRTKRDLQDSSAVDPGRPKSLLIPFVPSNRYLFASMPAPLTHSDSMFQHLKC